MTIRACALCLWCCLLACPAWAASSTVSLEAVTGSVVEDAPGAQVAFRVLVTPPAPNTTIRVFFAPLAGSATSGVDYTEVSLDSITLSPNTAASAPIVLNVNADGAIEPDETVVVAISSIELSGNDAAAIGTPSTWTGTIRSDEHAISITSVADAVAEDAGEPLQFTLSCTPAATAPITVALALAGTATPGTDIVATALADVVIPIGATSSSLISAMPKADALVERNETVIATVSGATITAGAVSVDPGATWTGTIVDDETTVSLDRSADTAVAGALFPEVGIVLSQALAFRVTVTLGFAGTASTANGILADDGTQEDVHLVCAAAAEQTRVVSVVVPAGTKRQILRVQSHADAEAGDETFQVRIAGASAGTIGGASTYTATIVGAEALAASTGTGPQARVTGFSAVGEAAQAVVWDGRPPFAVVQTTGCAVQLLGTAGFQDVDGDQDLDPRQRFLVTATAPGGAHLLVEDGVGSRIAIGFPMLPAEPGSAVTLPAPPVPRTARGERARYAAVCPGSIAGRDRLLAAIAGKPSSDVRAFAWDAVAQGYVELPRAPAGGLLPSHGVFIAARIDVPLDFSATPLPQGQPVLLQPGWNLIGVPLMGAATARYGWDDAEAALFDADGAAVAGAARTQRVDSVVWSWDGGAYQAVSSLESGKAYWVHLDADATHRVTFANTVAPFAPDERAGVARASTRRPPPPPSDGAGASSSGSCGSGAALAMLALSLAFGLRRLRE